MNSKTLNRLMIYFVPCWLDLVWNDVYIEHKHDIDAAVVQDSMLTRWYLEEDWYIAKDKVQQIALISNNRSNCSQMNRSMRKRKPYYEDILR